MENNTNETKIKPPSFDEGIVTDPSKKMYILIVAGLATFFSAFITTSITVALPTIANQFQIDVIVQTWIATIFLLAVAICSAPFGKISGKFGLKKFLMLGVLIMLFSCLGAAFSTSAEMLLLFRAFQGVGSAMLSVSTVALVSQAMPFEERGKAIGINISCVYIGLTLGPVVGGIVTQYIGWETMFLIVIPFLIINLIICHLKVDQEWKMGEKDSFDYIGTILYSIGILLGIYGFTIINTLTGVILAIIGLIVLGGFVRYELKQKTPVFEVKLFKNTKFSSSTLAALISYLATFLITLIITYHLQYIKGMDPQYIGLILIVTSGLMAIIAPFSGRLSDKINPQKLSAIGMIFVALSVAILSFLDANTPLYVIIIAMALEGIGLGLFTSPNTNAIMSSVPRKFTSIASATVSTARVVGQTLSLGMFTILLAVIVGSVQVLPDTYPELILSSQIAFIISTVLCIIAILLSFAGIKSKTSLNEG